jgi:hypothetical protein
MLSVRSKGTVLRVCLFCERLLLLPSVFASVHRDGYHATVMEVSLPLSVSLEPPWSWSIMFDDVYREAVFVRQTYVQP